MDSEFRCSGHSLSRSVHIKEAEGCFANSVYRLSGKREVLADLYTMNLYPRPLLLSPNTFLPRQFSENKTIHYD